MQKPIGKAVAVAVCALLTGVFSACSTDGHAVSDADPAAQAAVDIKALDTGKYPTNPRPPFGKPGTEYILEYEAQRMAQFIVAPFEIDQDLTRVSNPTYAVTGTNALKGVLTEDVASVDVNKKAMLYGYVATAGTPDVNLRQGNRRSVVNMVLRYMTPDDAAEAVKQMGDLNAKQPRNTEIHPAGMSGSRVMSYAGYDDTTSVSAYTQHNDYVLYTWYQASNAQKDTIEPAIKKAIALQGPLIDQFPATPTKAEAKAKNLPPSNTLMDQDHILIYALPYTDEELKEGKTREVSQGSTRAVYGPRGMALRSTDPPTTFKLLTDVGSTANAVERTTVYRAKTDDGGTRIFNEWYSGQINDGWKAEAAPPNLPVAKCLSKNDNELLYYWCEVKVGRYVGEISGTDKKDIYQQTAAQYVILTKADQKAN
ncbi:DUF7373 family lipoprotein [Gordonia otitidis]|uniref:Lipoprotein n=1 Tax=Gordonia otitidis (strain DSM 44809 / CCUG 52243 / JCM 12355 / NBRC 100426 / IFM 10032) TaxID=1108044 RepID=H5TR00_GORO1|nr:hypothetical protein [Gordonia otitidis]GAB35908.1 hypothetical protein GOOTI_187_00430 [Gordonia otitidis NBRC 100426]